VHQDLLTYLLIYLPTFLGRLLARSMHVRCAITSHSEADDVLQVQYNDNLEESKTSSQPSIIYTVSQKRPTFTTCYNFYMHSSIATISGINIAKKVGNQNILYFPTTPN